MMINSNKDNNNRLMTKEISALHYNGIIQKPNQLVVQIVFR